MPPDVSTAPPAGGPRSRATGWLPQGRALSAADFAGRHRIVCALLAVHVPVVLVLCAAQGRSALFTAAATGPLLALLLAALAPLPRRTRSSSATLGLALTSGLAVVLFPGSEESTFSLFVVAAVIALYQDWVAYALALTAAVAQNALLAGGVLGAEPAGAGPAVAGVVAVAAELAVLVLFWHAHEQAGAQEEQLQHALAEGQSSVRARLEDTDRIRTDLIGTVSHEFRTPLTGIRAAALTLLKRGERLDAQGREQLLQAVLDGQERLSRLLENMLTASRATAVDAAAVTEVDAVAVEVAMLAGSLRPESPRVSVVVEPGTVARIERQALHQVLANLIDNAQHHGSPASTPLLAGGHDDRGVWVAVSNEGVTLDPDAADRLFQPFTQQVSGPTREHEGLGMGLYVVRRLVEVHGGWVEVRSENGWVTVEVRLQPAAQREVVTAG